MGMDMDMNDTETNCSMMSMMPMYFSTDLPVTIAFKGWLICDRATLIGSCFGIAGIAILYEILKKLRQYFWRIYYKRSPYAATSHKKVNPSCRDTANEDARKPSYAYFWGMHALNSLTFLIQAFLGYLLMLIVMAYNVYVVVSVVVGLALGYFLAYFVGAAFGLNEDQVYEVVPENYIQTIDMVVANKSAAESSKQQAMSEEDKAYADYAY